MVKKTGNGNRSEGLKGDLLLLREPHYIRCVVATTCVAGCLPLPPGFRQAFWHHPCPSTPVHLHSEAENGYATP